MTKNVLRSEGSTPGLRPVAVVAETAGALLLPAVATTLTVYREPGTRELNRQLETSVSCIRTVWVRPEMMSSRVTLYQST